MDDATLNSQPSTSTEDEPSGSCTDLVESGIAAFESGQAASALCLFEKALSLDPKSPQAHNGLGAVLLSQGQVDAALAEFEESIRLAPSFCKPYQNRAALFLLIGEPDRALADFNIAISLAPDFLMALLNRGGCLQDLK